MKKIIFIVTLSIFIICPFIINLIGWNIYLFIQIGEKDLIVATANGLSHNAWAKHISKTPDEPVDNTVTISIPYKVLIHVGPIHLYSEKRLDAMDPYSFKLVSPSELQDYQGIEFPWLLLISIPFLFFIFLPKNIPNENNTDQEKSKIFWLKKFSGGRLGTMNCPQGGELLQNEISNWKKAGIKLIASALTDNEMRELELLNTLELCQVNNIEFIRFPIIEKSLPESMDEWLTFIQSLQKALQDKKKVVTLSQTGVGRASLIAISIMIVFEFETEDALQQLAKVRGLKCPETEEQIDWLYKFEDFIHQQKSV